MIDVLSMEIKIIDFTELKINRNPIGYGATAFVYPGFYKNTPVAVKVFVLNRLLYQV